MKAKQVNPNSHSKFAPYPKPLKEPKLVAIHRLTVSYCGAHTRSNNRLRFTLFFDNGATKEIGEIEFNIKYKGSGVPLYGGTVTRPLHSFAGVDVDEVRKMLVSKGVIKLP